MYMIPSSWDGWRKYFEARHYKTLAPAWPCHQGTAAELREAHPNEELGAVEMEDLLEMYRKIIKDQKEKPILVGHSMGGLIVQLLMEEGLGAAGVAIDSAPPKGLISLRFSFLKSYWPVNRPLADPSKPILLTKRQFNYAFVHTLAGDEQEAVYEKFVVPDSRRVGRGPQTDDGIVDYCKPRRPLLIISGKEDHIIPSALNYSNFKKYEDSPSRTEFRMFDGRTHWIVRQEGWEEVAAFVEDWLARN